ncbi:hypothetical protein SS50377_28433 [Spironucleus salmonicida]|uniref:Uncharacterized protein n=1 Tax=Spironucleus salmonicida TaxID=348837 RepID=V6LFA4_9EUKA|nr:hypothetical protein SS50377_28433 [Spironucleus salmonicida]|eukprot:EST43205.1 Hypothetical protein SS50377_17148 [Spironucleus salmonicida]
MSTLNGDSLFMDNLEQSIFQNSPEPLIPSSAMPGSKSSPQPFSTPQPMQTPAVPKSHDTYDAVQSLQEQIQQLTNQVNQLNNSGAIQQQNDNQSVFHNPFQNKNIMNTPFHPPVQSSNQNIQDIQVPAGYLMVSQLELEQMVANKVREKLAQSESQLQHTLRVDERLKTVESALMSITKSLSQSREIRNSSHCSSLASSDLQNRLDRVQKQIEILGIKK